MSSIQKHFLIFIDGFGQVCYPQKKESPNGFQLRSFETRVQAEEKLRSLILESYDGTWEQFLKHYTSTNSWMSYSENAVLYNGAFEISLHAIDDIILAGVVSIEMSQERVKQFAVIEWKVHPHHKDHPYLLSSVTSSYTIIVVLTDSIHTEVAR